MSARESESAAVGDEVLTEDDSRETEMAYDSGGIPAYVTVAWVLIIGSYIAYMLFFGLPDFREWGAP